MEQTKDSVTRLVELINYIGNIGNRPDIRDWKVKILGVAGEIRGEILALNIFQARSDERLMELEHEVEELKKQIPREGLN